jgi:hypothetical protein
MSKRRNPTPAKQTPSQSTDLRSDQDVDRAFSAIEGVYVPLTIDQRRELTDRLLDTDWFGRHMKTRYFRKVAEFDFAWRQQYEKRNRKADPKLDAELVRLRDQEGKSFGALAAYIAEDTGESCTYNAASKRYARAKNRLSRGRRKKL